jgi:hypothetical protein
MTPYESGFLSRCSELGVPERLSSSLLKRAAEVGLKTNLTTHVDMPYVPAVDTPVPDNPTPPPFDWSKLEWKKREPGLLTRILNGRRISKYPDWKDRMNRDVEEHNKAVSDWYDEAYKKLPPLPGGPVQKLSDIYDYVRRRHAFTPPTHLMKEQPSFYWDDSPQEYRPPTRDERFKEWRFQNPWTPASEFKG